MSHLMKDLPSDEKPREKVKLYGVEHLTNAELLAILLRTGSKSCSVKDLSIEILQESNGLDGLRDMRLSTLKKIKGIGDTKAITLLAAIELGKRMKGYVIPHSVQIKETKDVYEYYHKIFQDEVQEKFLTLFLDVKNHVIYQKILFIGTANQSFVHPRDIFKEAILNNAIKILCVHNHPTGDVTPSKEDIQITKRIQEIGALMGIPLLDHVVLGRDSYFSFLERGYL